MDHDQLTVQPTRTNTADIRIHFPNFLTQESGSRSAILQIRSDQGIGRELQFKLLGPRN